jgi:hypothetical protein
MHAHVHAHACSCSCSVFLNLLVDLRTAEHGVHPESSRERRRAAQPDLPLGGDGALHGDFVQSQCGTRLPPFGGVREVVHTRMAQLARRHRLIWLRARAVEGVAAAHTGRQETEHTQLSSALKKRVTEWPVQLRPCTVRAMARVRASMEGAATCKRDALRRTHDHPFDHPSSTPALERRGHSGQVLEDAEERLGVERVQP